MGLSVGLVGLPSAGKSTLFNALARASAAVGAYPFTTIEPNVAVVPVPDPRLERLAALVGVRQQVPATIEFVDIAGLVRGAHRGEGLGNQFLGHIRGVDAVAMVLRCFRDPEVAHVEGGVDPVRDVDVVALELALADLAVVDRRLERTTKVAKSGDRRAQEEAALLTRLREHLDRGGEARTCPMQETERELVRGLGLLTAKPIIYVANVDEASAASPHDDEMVRAVERRVGRTGDPVVALCARLEMELAALGDEEAEQFRRDLGLPSSGLDQMVRAAYQALGLVTFFTATGEREVRAWAVPVGTTAPAAAGRVHSDMERGFIRAEVVGFDDLARAGSMAEARERGLVRVEGRDYVIADGDVVHVRFHA